MKNFPYKKTAEKTIPLTKLNKRIDKKLDIVAEIFESAATEHWRTTSSDIFNKELFFQDFRYMEHLKLKYNCENRFFSISYNLEMSIDVSEQEEIQEIGDCVFQVKNTGGFMKKKPVWVCGKFTGTENMCANYLRRLNNEMILDRVDVLDLTRVAAYRTAEERRWVIRCESLIGSATWILIPPVVNLIKPTMEECVKVLEFFELTADAIVNNK